MAICNLDRSFLAINPAFTRMTGYTLSDLEGKSFLDITHPDDREGNLSLNQEALRTEEASQMEKRYIRKDGKVLSTLLTLVINRDERGEAVHYIGQIVDISRVKEAEALALDRMNALQVANRDLDQFAYLVSHDLKAPLRHIQTLVGFIREDLQAGHPEAIPEYLEMLQARTERMDRMIEGVLEYSRAGRRPLQEEWLDLEALVREALEVLHIPESVQVHCEGLPRIFTSRVALYQILQNLISNAWRHNNAAHPRIEVGCKVFPDKVELWVADNGTGIPPAYHDKIFQLFQTLVPGESTGIGLAIVKRCAEEIGARIQLKSEPGVGSKFILTLYPQK